MQETQIAAGVRGRYRDRLRDARGRVVHDSGWHSNVITDGFRTLLAGFVRGVPTGAVGVTGLWLGAGDPTWDAAGTPPGSSARTVLVDPQPFLVPRAQLGLEFLAGAAVSPAPTNRLQIVAHLGPGVPAWPDAQHASGNLREFGLVCQLDGAPLLVNYVAHPVIAKDPAATLERTIWLVF
jgi:hypothetical protein